MKKIKLLIVLSLHFLWASIFVLIVMIWVLIEHIIEQFKIKYYEH
jgi:hypothetical protein